MTHVVSVVWTDPESGRREVRRFPGGVGSGELRRALKRAGIPSAMGSAVDVAAASTVGKLPAPWRPDKRVWSSFRRPSGDAA